MSEIVTQLQAAPAPQIIAPSPVVASAPQSAPEVVTRNAVLDLASVVDLAANAPPVVDASADIERLRNAQRLETLAQIDAGLQDIIDAVVAGEYDIQRTTRMTISRAVFTLRL